MLSKTSLSFQGFLQWHSELLQLGKGRVTFGNAHFYSKWAQVVYTSHPHPRQPSSKALRVAHALSARSTHSVPHLSSHRASAVPSWAWWCRTGLCSSAAFESLNHVLWTLSSLCTFLCYKHSLSPPSLEDVILPHTIMILIWHQQVWWGAQVLWQTDPGSTTCGTRVISDTLSPRFCLWK
jgi:hypothetical protein